MAIDPTRTVRGALAGVAGASVWAAQEPLDRRVLRSRYSDPELLGRLLTNGPRWPVVGLAMHLANGALFGAVYANVAPRLPVAAWLRGPLAGLSEHLASWPLTRLVDRLHPARDRLPPLGANPRAFVQATWRHLVFATVVGELERRLNPEPEDAVELVLDVGIASTNGHGDLERAVALADRRS